MTLPIMDLDSWTLSQSIVVFSVCALVIAIAGTRITRVVDQLADRTGLGEATAGAVLLGAATSLSGSVLSVTAAYRGQDRKSTRLNSSHVRISYAVFCLKKKTK